MQEEKKIDTMQHEKVQPEECEYMYTPKESSHNMQEAKLNPKELKQHEKVHPEYTLRSLQIGKDTSL